MEFDAQVSQSDLRLVQPKVAARILGLSHRTLERYRRKGGGPVFVALGRSAVRYRECDLRDYVESRVARHTAQSRVLRK